MKNQNITLKIDSGILRKSKILAAHRGTSLSALLAGKLSELVGEDAEYEAAKRHAFQWLDRGWHLGRRPSGDRGSRS